MYPGQQNPNFKKAKVKIVVGEGTGETVFSIDTSLLNPDYKVKNPVIDERFEIDILNKHLFKKKVVIQSKLNKNIIYKAIKNNKNFVAHKAVEKPFTVEILIPELEKIKMKQKCTINKNDLEIQVHIEDIESDIVPGQIYNCPEENLNKNNQSNSTKKDSQLILNNPSLAHEYEGNLDYDIKNFVECNDNIQLDIHEKILIKLKATVSRWEIVTIPTYKY